MGKINDMLIRHAVESAERCEPYLTRQKPERAKVRIGKGLIQGPIGFGLGRIFEDMYQEERKNYKAYDKYLNELDLQAEASLQAPRRFEVHQPWDPVVHESWW
jgi:hypothetical protein